MTKLYFIILFLLFFPVLDIGGHFISAQEIFLYLASLFSLKKFRKQSLVSPYLFYFFGFFVMLLITSMLAQSTLNNHDIYVLRNCAQSICALFLFDHWFRSIADRYSHLEMPKILTMVITLCTLPCLLVFLQRVDLFGMRDIVLTLYKPQFHFLGEEQFSSYRYTSIFKDFFTFSCFAIVLAMTQLVMMLKMPIATKSRVYLFLLFLMTYLSQFYVARTSVILIPLFCFMLFWFYPVEQIQGGRSRKLLFFFLSIPILCVAVISLFYFNVINENWIREGISALTLTPNADSSVQVMQEWNIGFFQYLRQNPSLLFIPKHSYDLTVTANPALYTDSFYAQEIYRYGIYGMILYFLFVIWLWRKAKRLDLSLALFVLMAVMVNYKGGNVFFMHKNAYLYPLFFSLVLLLNRTLHNSQLHVRHEGVEK